MAWIGYVGRLNYNYADKYLFSASIRRDGHSRFGPANRWATFPSVSAGWRISEEPFMANITAVSDLKIRGSWGQTGNNNIGNYRYEASLQSNYNYHFADNVLVSGTTPGSLANEELGWETSTMTNIGLDIGFLNDKLRFSAEYYQNTLDDMLLVIPISYTLGFTDPRVSANAGSAETSGFEIDLGYRNYDREFKWSVDLNLGTSKNEVTSLGAGQPILAGGFGGDNITRTEVGHPIGSFYGYVVDGLFQSYDDIRNAADQGQSPFEDDGSLKPEAPFTTTAPGDIRFKDLAGPEDEDGNLTEPDGIIDANDKTYIGNPFPDVTYGLNATFEYKGFDLNIFISGVQGNDIFNRDLGDLEAGTRVFNASTAVLDRWTGPNTSTTQPRMITGDPNRNGRASDRFVEDGSFTRLRNVTLGYNIPRNILDNFANGAISGVRVYVSGQNLLTITDYSGYDPEIGGSRTNTLQFGLAGGNYPQPRTIISGLKISF